MTMERRMRGKVEEPSPRPAGEQLQRLEGGGRAWLRFVSSRRRSPSLSHFPVLLACFPSLSFSSSQGAEREQTAQAPPRLRPCAGPAGLADGLRSPCQATPISRIRGAARHGRRAQLCDR